MSPTFNTLLPTRADTLRTLEAKILQVLNNGGGGGGGSAQVLVYTTTDPTTDGIVPTSQNSPAIAYKKDGTGPTYGWNTTTHLWV